MNYLYKYITLTTNYSWKFIHWGSPYICKFIEWSWLLLRIIIKFLMTMLIWGFPYVWMLVTWAMIYFWRSIQYIWTTMTIISRLKDQRFKSDEILQLISKYMVKLKPEDVKENNQILKHIVVDNIIPYMKLVDSDFNDLFQDILYGGSFYKNLKVSKPDEYDLCLMVNLSRSINSRYVEIDPDTDTPTYVKIKILENEFIDNEDFWLDLMDENCYLNQNKFRSWIHSALHRALNSLALLGPHRNQYFVEYQKNTYCVKFRQTGPAFTLNITRINDRWKMDVDMVPCLVFQNYTSLNGFRAHKEEKFITIAKPLKLDSTRDKNILWRVGFYNDEKRLLAGQLKPIIRLTKKLRDVHRWYNLKSYFIETVFMHELDDLRFRLFYPGASRLAIFIYMLRRLQSKLEEGKLADYWHINFNLLDKTNTLPVDKVAQALKKVIKEIDDNIEDDERIIFDIFKPKRAYENDDIEGFTKYLPLFVLIIGYKIWNSVSEQHSS